MSGRPLEARGKAAYERVEERDPRGDQDPQYYQKDPLDLKILETLPFWYMIGHMSVPSLALERVSHRFGALEALSGVDLHVGEHVIYGFLGLNGAGKTTAIRLILGLIRLRAGDIRIFGSEVRRRPPELYRKVGVLFEDFAAHGYLTALEHLFFHARFLGLDAGPARTAAERWLDRVGLSARSSTKVRNYSMGMKRRLGLACALAGSPGLVILDEPTNGLDPQGISDLRELILELNRDEGVTFFLSSHILGEVEQLCGSVGILHRGRMLLEGRVEDLTGRSASRRRLRAAPAEAARRLLEAASWCAGVEAEDRAVEALHVRVKEDDVPRMIRELVTAGIDIREVSSAAESLESVFHRAVSIAETRADIAGVPGCPGVPEAPDGKEAARAVCGA